MSQKSFRTEGIIKTVIITALIICAGFLVNLGGRYLEKVSLPREHIEIVEKYAKEYDFDPAFIFAVIKTESGFRKDAVSSVGAIGLMQIMPSTAEKLAERLGEQIPTKEELFSPGVNIRYGCEMLSWMREEFEVSDTLLAAYNAGWGNVKKWLSDKNYSDDGITLKKIPFEETKNFIKRVNKTKDKYRELYYNGGK